MLRSCVCAALLVIFINASFCPLLVVHAHAQARSKEPINLNTASRKELEDLPGIGPTIAARIVEHREKHGPFKRPQDVIIVRGMYAKLYRSLAPFICV